MESNSTDKVEWGRQAEAADHLKKIQCRVKHPALKAPYMEISRSIDVKCANFSISPVEHLINYCLCSVGPKLVEKQVVSGVLGAKASLELTVKANPVVDRAEWSVDGKPLEGERFNQSNTTKPTQVNEKQLISYSKRDVILPCFG
jgi:hypothetical protein